MELLLILSNIFFSEAGVGEFRCEVEKRSKEGGGGSLEWMKVSR